MTEQEKQYRDDDEVEDIVCAFAASGSAHEVARDMLMHGPGVAQASADAVGQAAAMVGAATMAAIRKQRALRDQAREAGK